MWRWFGLVGFGRFGWLVGLAWLVLVGLVGWFGLGGYFCLFIWGRRLVFEAMGSVCFDTN